MAEVVTKNAVLDRIDSEQAQWEDLLAEIGEERMNRPGAAGEWTFKDVVAHLSGWRQRSLDRLEAATRGEPEPPPPWPEHLVTDDEINDWMYSKNQDRSLQDVLGESRGTFVRMRTLVQALPEEDLSDPNRFGWMNGQALGPAILNGAYFSHMHEEHEPAIRDWLAAGD